MRKNLLIFILLLAAFLRFYRLEDYPALNADEAAIGYNAYSLIQTGKDEHGNSWPIHFQSFNDYKPGLYFYIVLPFVKYLGLNTSAVRIPGALFGGLTVLVVYLLVKELEASGLRTISSETSLGRRLVEDNILALTSALFLAISPWHIHFSRGGWEANVATFFITTGLWLFLKSLKNPKYYVLCTSFFVLSLYTYHASRVVVPVLGIGLLILYKNQIRKNLRPVVVAGLISLVLLAPLILDLTRGSVFSRAVGVGLFADPGPLNRINEQRGEHNNFRSLPAILLHNKPVNYSLAFLENWSDHFWGEFLFLSGDEVQRNRVPETGQMYLLDILFLIAGFVAIAKNSRGWGSILLWLAVAPAAAGLTFQSPHALRAQSMAIPLAIIAGQGLIFLSLWLHKTVKKKPLLDLTFIVFVFTFSWGFARHLHMYWVHMSKEYPFSSQYGAKELVAYVQQKEDRYEKIIVTDKYDQPYILFLFYLKYPPEKFQLEHDLTPRDKFGFSTVKSFGEYYFMTIDYDKIRPEYPNSLIVGTDKEIPDEANVVKEIYGTNGYKYFQVVVN